MMRTQRLVILGVSIGGALFAGALLAPPAAMSQLSPNQASPKKPASQPLMSDWSSHHVIFSKAANPETAERMKNDVRYQQQLLRQSLTPRELREDERRRRRRRHHRRLHRDWSEDLGAGATVGAMNYPAKYSFLLNTANCATATQPDFVVYNTNLTGSSTQASIVAYDNLYAGCGGTVPSVYWAYDTDGTVTTSPVFSRDGTQVAFTQTDGLGNGYLVVLKWAPSTTDTVAAPEQPARVTNAEYPTCTAPCMATTLLTNASFASDNDINSPVFYDYGSDTAYVGDSAGWLHQVVPFFLGAPSEVRSGGWPVQVNPGAPTALTGPVYDPVSGFAFVADVGGFLYRVGPNSAFVVSSGELDFSSQEGGAGIVQGPVVDPTSESIYVFASSDGSAGCTLGADCSAVYHLPVAFVPGSTGSEAVVGNSTTSGTAPNPLYIGGFDSNYLNSTNGTGDLYVCGNTGGAPTLYQIQIQTGILGAVSAGPVISANTTPCSPVSDFPNPNIAGGETEWIFASAQSGGVSTPCANGGCIFNFKDTPWQPSTAYTAGQEVLDSNFHVEVVKTAGTSGIATPFWTTSPGGATADGSITWLDQGPSTAATPAAWTALHHYARGAYILDGNGNVELATTAGISGALIPAFNATVGGTTTDATVTWTNVGVIATAALPASGGASGTIFDNAVSNGTLAGASQVYFSTLGNQACGTSGTGGCAVQASQPALQ